jgi:signal transduction histidine kinase/CheY-like chemotaxis protein
MKTYLPSWLAPLPIADPLEQRQAALLRVILFIFLAIFLLFLLSIPVASSTLLGLLINVGSIVLALALTVGGLLLLRLGRLRAAVFAATLALLIPLALIFIPSGITYSRGLFLVFALPITLVGLLGRRSELVMTTLITASLLIITGILEQLQPPLAGFVPFEGDIFIAALSVVLPTLILIAVLLDRFGQAFREALAESSARAQELERLRSQLEATVAERTAELRQAYAELECRVQERTLELSQANATLREREMLIQTVVTHAPLVLFAFDREGIFTLSEGRGLVALHLRPGEVIGRSIFQMYSRDSRILEHTQRALQGEAIHSISQVGDGTLETWLSPLRDEQGVVNGVIGVAVDISDRTRLEARLLQAQKMDAIGRLAGGVAHDFNNLLTAITGYVEIALADLPPDHAIVPDLHEIRRSAARAAALTRQLLAFARKQIIDPRVLSLNDLILEVDKLLRRLIGEDIELVALPAPDLWLVKVDAGQIEQLLVNLVVNARDAMPGGGRLIVETGNIELDETFERMHISVTPGPYVMLAVSDTGAGMPPEVQAQLFEPFFTTKELGKGTGLGLATCYGIVKQHGGTIWVYSEAGKGTTIKVYLPRVDAPAAPRQHQVVPETLPSGVETVLLVEDEPTVRDLATRVLRAQGYTVLVASDGTEGLARADEYGGGIQLLLADVVMPRIGGKALADQLLSRRPGIKLLFMSGYTDSAIVHRGQLDPGVAFIQKPFTPGQLARKVRETLDAPAAPQPGEQGVG